MDEWMNYEQFDRQTWHSFFPTNTVRLSQDNLEDIKSLNDRISIQDLQDVYLPLIKLIQLRYQNFLEWQMQKANFLLQSVHRVPYIIGIAGSVAVGKSTIARLLSILLNKLLPDKRVELIHVKELLGLTGYIRGGCSPIGMKKAYPTFIHESALLYDYIYISAGVRGLQMKIAPSDLFSYTGAEIYPI